MAVQLFLSCVSKEFGVFRARLGHELTLPDVAVKIQEEFKPQGGDTLGMLADYLTPCAAIVHFVGDLAGAAPPDICVQALLKRHPDVKTRLPPLAAAIEAGKPISYTQWEAWLALYLEKPMLIVTPASGVPRDPNFNPTAESRVSQAEHLARLAAIDRFPGKPFVNEHDLAKQILASSVIPALRKAAYAAAAPARQPRNLPYPSLGPLLMGREKALDELRAALIGASGRAALVGKALHGLGGVGKTRLAIEYAWRHEADYSALLFIRADDPDKLNASLAALAGAAALDLVEKDEPRDDAKIEAALRWLEAHPTWLIILDNVDDEKAVVAVGKLLARLKGGHVVVTARASNFPAGLRKLEVGVLDEDAATEFLLERTREDREPASDDPAKAREIARELGGLALGLEQAGAYIATERIGFARYLELWRDNRARVLEWFEPDLMSYDHDAGLAATWATSVARLTPESRRMLDRLAMLAPDPIPDSLLEVAVPGEAADYDAQKARTGLYAYSLITRTANDDRVKGFTMHRLVQDFARRAMTLARAIEATREALQWVNAGFSGDLTDVRNRPTLDPLASHALAVARRADEVGIAEPTWRLFYQLALFGYGVGDAEPLFRRALAVREASYGPDHPNVAIKLVRLGNILRATNHLGEAEPLFRRALAIDEAKHGPDHPTVASRLNSLALLLKKMNRFGDAEPLYRRAISVGEASLGTAHPDVAAWVNNLAVLLQATNRLGEAEPLFRRAISISEASHGPDHPDVAIGLNSLADLLQSTNRLGEAEPLFRRALAIDEASLGPAHPGVAVSLNGLAVLLRATKRLGEAEPLIRRALAIDEASFGPDHLEVARDLVNLAALLNATNRPDEAEPMFRRALAIFKASLGADHPSTAIARDHLAALETARWRGGA